MARSYARMMTAIWRDKDFLALSERAQRAYMMLVTQPEITAAGVLPLKIRWWASKAADSSVEGVTAALMELASKYFIIADETSMELLVRSFIKWDGGASNQKRRPVILGAAAEVNSPLLRRALVIEFQRVGLPTEALEGDPEASELEIGTNRQEDLFSQVDSLSDTASGMPSAFSRVAVTYLSSSVPQPTTSNQQPLPGEPAAAPKSETMRAQTLAGAYVERVPLSNFPAVMAIARKAINTGLYEDDQIQDALLRIADAGHAVTVDRLRLELEGTPRLRLVSGGYQPYRNPDDQSVYDERI